MMTCTANVVQFFVLIILWNIDRRLTVTETPVDCFYSFETWAIVVRVVVFELDQCNSNLSTGVFV